jgi:hypothetical protein
MAGVVRMAMVGHVRVVHSEDVVLVMGGAEMVRMTIVGCLGVVNRGLALVHKAVLVESENKLSCQDQRLE